MATKTVDIMHAVTELMKIHDSGASHSVGHVEYQIIEHNELLIAIIPGTNGLRDVFDNMKFSKKELKIHDIKYKVHKGFLEQADSIFEKVQVLFMQDNPNGSGTTI